ncbi:MAG: hypothetical protein QOK21_3654 [Solirubrobacteraceae bacterium]|nr:hypothetical protein [Solirubrobacteraceae bacterium]
MSASFVDLRRRPAVSAGQPFRALVVFAGAAAAAFMVTRAVGDEPLGFAIVIGTGVAIGTALFFSERYTVSLGFLAAYLGLADGFLKLRYGGNAITVVRDVLVLAIVAGAIVRLAVRKTAVTLPPATGLVVAWVVVVLLQLFNPANGTLMHSVQALRQQIEWVPLFFLGFAVMRTKGRLRGFFVLLLVVTTINGIVALVQYRAGPDAVAAWGPGYADKIYGTVDLAGRTFYQGDNKHLRPFGLGSDTGFGGNLAVLAAPAAWAFIALTRRRAAQFLGAILAAGVVLAAVTSQTRLAVIGTVVAFASSFAFAMATRRAVVAIVSLLVLGGIAYGAIAYIGHSSDQVFSRYSTILGRKAVTTPVSYKRGSFAQLPSLLEKHPFGAGFGSAGPGSSTPGAPATAKVLDAENEFNFLLIETGVLGLVTLLAFHVGAVLRSVAAVRRQRDPETRLLLAGIAAPLVAMLVMWFGGPVTGAPPGSPFLWFGAGVIAYWATAGAPPRRAGPARKAAAAEPVTATVAAAVAVPRPLDPVPARERSIASAARWSRTEPVATPQRPVREIALVSAGAAGPFDAIDGYTRQLARALDELPGFRSRICPLAEAASADAVLLQYNPFSWGRRGFAPELLGSMRRLRSQRRRPPLATMIHEPFVAPQDARTTVMAGWQRAQLAAVKALSDRVLAPSADAARRARGLGGPIPVVPVGSNLPDLRERRLEARDDLGVDDDDLLLITFERSRAGRVHAHVIAAVEAAREVTRTHLLVLGAEAEVPPELEPSGGVWVAGPVPDEELAHYLSAGDVFLADYADGLSTRRTSLVAALQHALPIVGTTVGRTDPELLDSDGIVAVEARDVAGFAAAVRSLAASPAVRGRRSAAARRLFEERFDWPVVARRLVRVIGLEA